MLERMLVGSRYLVSITIVITTAAAVFIYIFAAMSAATIIVDTVRDGPWLPKVAKEAAISFLNVVDLLLIAAGFQMIALGIHQFLDLAAGERATQVGEDPADVEGLRPVLMNVVEQEDPAA